MNKRFTNRLLSLLLAWWLVASFVLPVTRAEPAADVTISTVGELRQFAKSCALDTWSQGKTVLLAADLDLASEEFEPIPTFGGTFLGQGHTISGLRITKAGSNQGLFRYVQPGAVVRNLNVKGTVAPGGTRCTVGGIVGDNSGTLQSCTFSGTVRGDAAVGGVAGRNSGSGQLIGCSAAGSVSGQTATGGVAGRNLGLLLECENSAGVNLTEQESSVDLLDVDTGEELAERTAGDEAYHLPGSCSDTGGVVGYTSGVVQSCVNTGAVGYPHVGYNTGGIAGRQSGYLAGCVNSGTVHGRKDVGGIAGQAEPYLVLDPGRDTLERMRTELDTLDRLIDRALDDAQGTGDSVSARLEAMGTFTGSARDSSQQLLDRVGDFTDENIGSVNTLAADITNALDKISPALDDLSGVGGKLEKLSGQLEDALDEMETAVGAGDRVLGELRSAVNGLRQSKSELDTAASRAKQAVEAVRRFLHPGREGGGIALPSLDDLKKAREELRSAVKALREAGDGLDTALSRLERALIQARPLTGALEDALKELQGAAGSSASMGRLLRRALDTISDAVDGLTENGPAEFTPLGEDFRQASDSLFDSLAGLSGEMDGLREVIQSGGDTLTADLRAVSRQFNVVFDVLLDAMTDFQDSANEGIDDLIQDTSGEDIAATREGKIADCRNTGAVEGDRNVGGVVGAMAIELDLDPEDDRADLFSFGGTYETKAVLQGCLNYGNVTGKKDCVGGVAGRMDLGTALDCQNYGPASSTGGDFVGGVAGYADASIRSCYAKNTLSGGSYVGGIAGWASRLQDCWAIATITEGGECLGAVAGGVETDGVLRGNRFVDTGTAGVDGVSYAGRAEPVPFEELAQTEGVPLEFTAFTLTLLADGETVAQIPFLYGEDLTRVQLPPVPQREGSYGEWPKFDTSGVRSDLTVEAEYAPWVTVVASREISGKLALALADGQFTREASLSVTASKQASPDWAAGDALVWDISLTGTELGPEDAVPLRLLSPGGGDESVWQYENGQWRQVEAVRNGQYLLLTMTGTQGTFCRLSQPGVPWTTLAAGAAIAAAAVVLLAAAGRRRKKKSAKAATVQKEQEKESEN